MVALTRAIIDKVTASGNESLIRLAHRLMTHPYYSFEPRPSNPIQYDEQEGYVNSKALVSFCVGGNGCLAPEQEIFDPVTGKATPVGEIAGDFHVWSRSVSGRARVSVAHKPFIKGIDRLYRVSLASGESFISTLKHRVLIGHDTWAQVGQLRVGDSVVSACQSKTSRRAALFLTEQETGTRSRQCDQEAHQSELFPVGPLCTTESLAPLASGCKADHAALTVGPFAPAMEPSRQSVYRKDAGRSSRTPVDSLDHCSQGYRQYGAQPLLAEGSDPASLQQLDDALEHILLSLPSDDLRTSLEYSHAYQQSSRPPKKYYGVLERLTYAWQNWIALQLCLQSFGLGDTLPQDASASTSENRQNKADPQFLAGSSDRLRTIASSGREATELSSYCTDGDGGNVDAVTTKITSIEFVREGVFYDLHVPGDNNYQCAGTWHHNSGKTYCSAIKLAKFLLEEQPPPVSDCPFWVIAGSFEQVCQSTWYQKLRTIIPEEAIDHKNITWYKEKRQWPYSVPLKPWPGRPGKNWVIEFKSYEQGRELMQAAAIGGAWFTEQFPWPILEEVVRGCREYAFPGSIFADFTPIDPEKSAQVEAAYDKWEAKDPAFANWAFYRMNTEVALHAGHVKQAWYDSFFSMISDEMQETRKRGAFANYEGVIYQSFNPRVHLLDHNWPRDDKDGCIVRPKGVWYRRAIDWGSSPEHPFVCLWAYRNGSGQYFIYDEYWNDSQTVTSLDHIAEIKDRHSWPAHNPYWGTTYGDPSRPDQINLFNSQGIPISAGRNDVYAGIEKVRRLLKVNEATNEAQLYIDPLRCPVLARQMRTYRWKRSSQAMTAINPQVARPEPLKRDDDCVDALRYLLLSDSSSGKSGPKAHRIRTDSARLGVRK